MIRSVFATEYIDKVMIDAVYNPESLVKIREYSEIYSVLIGTGNLEEHKDYLKDTEVIFSTWGMPALSEQDIANFFPSLKAIFYAAGSVQHFARPFLNKGIRVVSAWAANAVPVAEYTVAQILLANKGFYQNSLKCKACFSSARAFSESFPGNYNVKVGILGAGMIGKKVIELLKPFNIEVLVYDPFLPDDIAKELHVKKCSLIEIFSQCQTISNHIANLPATVGLLNGEHFNIMLPNATFINTGRGAQVVENELIEALRKIPTRTAVLDVTEPEPPLENSEFYQMENVILTSHIAGSMSLEIQRMGLYMVDEFIRFIKGEDLKYNVSLEMLETMA